MREALNGLVSSKSAFNDFVGCIEGGAEHKVHLEKEIQQKLGGYDRHGMLCVDEDCGAGRRARWSCVAGGRDV